MGVNSIYTQSTSIFFTIIQSGQQLKQNEPWIYDSYLPSTLKAAYPGMLDAVNHVEPDNKQNIADLNSVAGVTFISFAKSKAFNAGE